MDCRKISKEFEKLESRGSFYKMAENLINKGFKLEAYFLILATWNFGYFRYVVKGFDIDNFKQTMDELEKYFRRLEKEKFKSINFDKYAEDIQTIYSKLANMKEIKYTGATKIMHLRCPTVFVMWDGYIKGDKTKRYYEDLDIVKNDNWEIEKYDDDAEGYLQFLKDMQIKFKDAKPSHNTHFTKCIDEFNFLNITLPIQEMEKNEKKK